MIKLYLKILMIVDSAINKIEFVFFVLKIINKIKKVKAIPELESKIGRHRQGRSKRRGWGWGRSLEPPRTKLKLFRI